MKTMRETSKLIALALRHKPEAVGIALDAHGWADAQALINGVNAQSGYRLTPELLEEIVATDEKQRYAFNEDHTKIRANQGLIPKSRLYVHLSADIDTARKVGGRHGRPVIYAVDCSKMVEDGYAFYLSANRVWLTKRVPAKYLSKET